MRCCFRVAGSQQQTALSLLVADEPAFIKKIPSVGGKARKGKKRSKQQQEREEEEEEEMFGHMFRHLT